MATYEIRKHCCVEICSHNHLGLLSTFRYFRSGLVRGRYFQPHPAFLMRRLGSGNFKTCCLQDHRIHTISTTHYLMVSDGHQLSYNTIMPLKTLHYGLPGIIVALLTTAVLAVASPNLEAYERATNQSLLWGPYRPNLYFGVRPRIPDGLLMGLMWAKVEDYQSIQTSMELLIDSLISTNFLVLRLPVYL
jgi:hypothetical protein